MDSVEKVKNFYEKINFEKFVSDTPRLTQEYIEKEIEFFKNYLDQNKKFLEIGCGYGRLMKVIKSNDMHGIDFSSAQISKAKVNLKKIPCHILRMDARRLRFRNNSFDYVVCANAGFGNMPGIESRVLSEMFRVVKKGGQIILSVFSERAELVQLENYKRLGFAIKKQGENFIETEEGLYSRRFTLFDLIQLFSGLNVSSLQIFNLTSISYIVIAAK